MSKKLEHDVAAAAMRERGADPQEEYPGANKKWHCLCMECGADIWPYYGNVVNGGHGACRPCATRKQVKGRTCDFVAPNGVKCDRPHQAMGLCAGHRRQHKDGKYLTEITTNGQLQPLSHEEAFTRAMEAWPDFVPPGIYPGRADKRWHGHCRACGNSCAPRLYHAGRKGHCGNCANHGYNRGKTGYFYFVAGNYWLKGGITNTPKVRLAAHKRQGMTEVLHLWEYADGTVPVDLERLWTEHLATLPDTDRPEKHDLKDGWTESIRRTVELEQWIEQTFKPLADDLLAAPLAA